MAVYSLSQRDVLYLGTLPFLSRIGVRETVQKWRLVCQPNTTGHLAADVLFSATISVCRSQIGNGISQLSSCVLSEEPRVLIKKSVEAPDMPLRGSFTGRYSFCEERICPNVDSICTRQISLKSLSWRPPGQQECTGWRHSRVALPSTVGSELLMPRWRRIRSKWDLATCRRDAVSMSRDYKSLNMASNRIARNLKFSWMEAGGLCLITCQKTTRDSSKWYSGSPVLC